MENAAREAAPTIGAYMGILRARKWFILSVVALVTIAAAIGVNLMTPIYRASATIIIENAKNKVISIEEIYGLQAGSREFFQTQAEFMKSREVGLRVVRQLGLANHPLFDPRNRKPGPVSGLLSTLPIPGLAKPADAPARPMTDEEAEEIVLAQYRDHLDIVPVRLTQLVEIRFESPDPFLAAKVANQTASDYITADLDARFEMQQTASKWLNERLETLRVELAKSEQKLQAFREQVGLIATPNASLGGTVHQLDTSAEKLILARIERAQAEQVYNQVSRGARNRYEVPAVFNNPAVVNAKAAEAAAEKRVNDAAQTLGEAHPEYKAALADLATARENTRRQSEGVIASIAKQYEVALATEKALEKAFAASRGTIQAINRNEGQLNVLEREVATNQQIYQTFLAKVKETDATADFRNPIARIVDPAVAPLKPVKPPKPQVIAVAAMIGALLAAFIAILRERGSAVIRSTEEVLEKLGAPLLVATPKLGGKELASPGRIQHDAPHSMFAEAVRSALTGVRLSLMDVSKPVLGFTSALPGEGKSTLALNFAIEQARTKRTLLIDADMRRPSIGKMLDAANHRMGLSEWFRGAPIEKCLVFSEEFNLTVMLAGDRVKNPHDMLMSPRLGELLRDLKTRYDLIVIDLPPLELVSDALPVGLQCSGMIYVVKAGETLIPIARRGLERLASANIPTLGVILNAHDFERAGKYYGEYSAYGSYGKAYYGTDDDDERVRRRAS